MNFGKEFEKYAVKHRGISSNMLDGYIKHNVTNLTPNIIEERPMNIAVMDVYSRLMMDRIIFLGYPVTDEVANIVTAQLLFLESTDRNRDIQMYINCPGGGVYAGLGMYDTMQFITPDIATICTGMAASMGAVLLTAGTKGKRFALPNSEIMIHQPLGGAQGQASDIEIHARHILATRERLNRILVKHTGQSIDIIQRDTDRDRFMGPEEAKAYGLVDNVVSQRGKSAKPDKKGGE